MSKILKSQGIYKSEGQTNAKFLSEETIVLCRKKYKTTTGEYLWAIFIYISDNIHRENGTIEQAYIGLGGAFTGVLFCVAERRVKTNP